MKLIEKILIAIILLSSTCFKLLAPGDSQIFLVFFVFSITALVCLLGYYIKLARNIAISIAFTLLIVGIVGNALMFLHWDLGYLVICGSLGSILFSCLLIRKLYITNNTSIFYYASAIVILAQEVIGVVDNGSLESYSVIITYFMVGSIATLKMNESKLEPALDNGLTYYLVTGIATIVFTTFQVLT